MWMTSKVVKVKIKLVKKLFIYFNYNLYQKLDDIEQRIDNQRELWRECNESFIKEKFMPHIKWVGIIKGDLGQYQMGDLAEGAKKVDIPDDMDEVMVKAIPFQIIAIVIITASVFVKVSHAKEIPFTPVSAIIGFVIGFLALIIHELLHAIVFPKKATVYVGIYPKSFGAVALSSCPLKRWRFVLMSLLPTLLGIVPIALFWVLPSELKVLNGLMLGMSMMGLTSPAVDFYNVYKVFRGTPKGCTLQFHGDCLYYYEKEN